MVNRLLLWGDAGNDGTTSGITRRRTLNGGLLARAIAAHATCGMYIQNSSVSGETRPVGQVQNRLRAYAKWLPDNYRIFVVVDRDNDDCKQLKQKLENIASRTQLLTRSQASGRSWQLVNRIAIEELEAWYFGDWQAVCNAYPRVSQRIPNQARYRHPDAIRGGTCEAFERILKRHGYFKTGLRKTEAARDIGIHIDSNRSRSHSFVKFREAILEATV